MIPDEAIHPEKHGLPADKKEAPLRIVTGDATTDTVLADRNYAVSGWIRVLPAWRRTGTSKTIEFSVHDEQRC